MKRIAVVSILLCACATAAFGALERKDGSCEAKAKSLTMSSDRGQIKNVTLVNEYFDDGMTEPYNTGVGIFYYKFTAQHDTSYTVWLTDASGAEVKIEEIVPLISFDLDAPFPSAYFDTKEVGGQERWIMYDWTWSYMPQYPEFSDPASATYYIKITGEIGDTVTLNFQKGVALPDGIRDNPEKLVFDTETQTAKDRLLSGDNGGMYYFRASMTQGRRYLFATTTGVEDLPLLIVDPEKSFESGTLNPYPKWAKDHNSSFSFVPGRTGDYTFAVSGTVATVAYGFAMDYVMLGARTMAEHNPAPKAVDGERFPIMPGRINDPDLPSPKSDEIIDNNIFSFTAEKGKRYAIVTEEAASKMMIRLYDSKGTILAESADIEGVFDARLGYEFTSGGTYYFGVAERLANDELDPLKEVGIYVRLVSVTGQDGDPDAYDCADDVSAGANGLAPLPGVQGDRPSEVDVKGHGPHQLGLTDWEDVFVIGARAGLHYAVTVTHPNGDEPKVNLAAELYTIGSRGTETPETIQKGSLYDESNPLDFYASKSAPYYLRLKVKEGPALDYPDYQVHVLAYSVSGAELGILTVNTHGAPGAQWYLDNESSILYPGGSSVLLDANPHKVTFKAVTNFTTPDALTGVVVTPGTVPTVYDVFYTDTKDPYDNQSSGKGYEMVKGKSTLVSYSPTAWTLKNTDTSFDRTLWEDDPADVFSFAATDGYFYNFALASVTGDAVFSITNATLGTVVEKVTKVSKLALPKTGSDKYYLIVSHGDEPAEGGSYRIVGNFANVGAIKLSTVALKVKEDAAKASFTVSRTAKDGRVRVKYGTVAGTAKPGVDYEAQNGILEWLPNDNKAKTIDIRLIPDLTPTYEGEDRKFSVKFVPVPEDERADDEYVATFTTTTKTTGSGASKVTTITTNDTVEVTLTETAKAVPGTIQLAGCANPKKPVVTIRAGASERIALERTLGTDGIVGVTVVSVKGTANKNGETDFEPIDVTCVWEDGVGGFSEPIEIRTKRTDGDFTGTKTFTLKLKALTSKSGDPVQYAKPTLAASSITVNIVNDKYEENVTDFAKTLPKTDGVAMKEAKKDSWFREVGAQGEEFYSVVSRKFTGPSRLWWGPSWDPFRTNLFVSAKGETVVMRSEDVYTNDLLQAATAAAPTVDKAVVAAGPLTLSFNDLPDDEARGIGYRVYVLSAGDKVKRPGAKSAVALKLGDPETEIPPPYVTNVAYTTTNKGKYTWRVDSFFTGGTVTNTAKSAWSFTVLKPEETAEALVVEGLTDGVTADLNLGVPVEYAIHTHDDAKAKVAVVSGTGSLPGSKLKLEQDKTTKEWFLRGYADKAGDFQCAIQATSGSPTMKSPTYVLKFHVAALPVTKEIVPLAPCVNKAVIEPCAGTNVSFKAEAGISYRAFFLEKGQKSAADPRKSLKLGDAETERTVTVTDGVASFDSEMAIGAKTNYTWVVYAYYEGGAVTNKSSTFSFDGAPVDADGRSYATNLRGHDAYGTAFEEGTPMVLRQRLPVEGDDIFEFYGEKLKSVAIASGTGSLPTGLKLDQDKGTTKAPGTMKWRIHGTPTKAGTFQLAVQATYTNYVEKTSGKKTTYTAVETKAATRVITFVVEAVDAPSDLSFTLAGPGRFVYTATDARIPVGQPDKTATKTNFISKASETLKLSDVERLHSYAYVKLPTPAALPPLVDKAVVAPETDVTLLFTTNAATDAANDIAYRVYVLSAGDKVVRQAGKSAVALKLGDPETEIPPPYVTNVAYTATNKGKYTWRVDSYFVDGPVTNVQKTAWAFSAADVSKLPGGAMLPNTTLVGTDVFGRDVGGAGKAGLGDNGEIALKQLVNVNLAVGAPGSTVKTVTGKLPTGVSLKAVKNADGKNQYFLTGTPGKAGEYPLVLQETGSFANGRSSVSVAGSTTAFTLVVAESDMAIGTFNGILEEDGHSLTNRCPSLGTIGMTVTSAGKLTATVKIANSTYAFSGTGFDSYGAAKDELKVELPLVKKIGTVTYTNVLQMTVLDGAFTNLTNLGRLAGSVRLTMAIPDANNKGAQEDIRYKADLFRDNTKSADYLAALADYAGYYTVSLPIDQPEPGKPSGNGYVTVTITDKGKATVAGMLADGGSVSCSYLPALVGDLSDPKSCALFVPVFRMSGTSAFGGLIVLRMGILDALTSGSAVADPGYRLRWCEDNASLTYYGDSGWDYDLIPSGGWYDKVINLQTYYLNCDFSVKTRSSDALPVELLADHYEFVPVTMPDGLQLELVGNTLNVPKQTLVKDADNKSLYDFSLCTNAANVKISFTRATGIVSGSFEIWSETDETVVKKAQKKVSGFKHQGVLVINRSELSPLDSSIWTAGYMLTPSITFKDVVGKKTVTRKYTASMPFDIIAEDQGETDPWERDWGRED